MQSLSSFCFFVLDGEVFERVAHLGMSYHADVVSECPFLEELLGEILDVALGKRDVTGD